MSSFQSVVIMSRPFAVYIRDYHQFKNKNITSVSDPVLQSLVVALVLTKLDYGSATLAGLPAVQLDRLQSMLNAAARLIYRRRKFDHVFTVAQGTALAASA